MKKTGMTANFGLTPIAVEFLPNERGEATRRQVGGKTAEMQF